MEFTKEFIIKNKGCYSLKQVNSLSFINNKIITLDNIINSDIAIKDKIWFIYNNCSFDYDERLRFIESNKKIMKILNKYKISSWIFDYSSTYYCYCFSGVVGDYFTKTEEDIILNEFLKYLNNRK